ncbi:ABC transporter permease [Candidatus Microgenomates bacterium]|nr:ABC transporter permease [Candidatus Microgenomates bacterium]
MINRLIMLWRVMVAGTRNFFRNSWLSMASTAVMTIALAVMLISVILNYGLNDALDDITRKIDIAVFFKDNVKPKHVEAMTNDLKQIENVVSVHYVDKSEALRRYREQYQDNPTLLEAITEEENPLPTSLEVSVKNLEQIDPILAVTQKEEYLPVVDPDKSFQEDRQKTVQRIGSIKRFLLQGGIVASALFATIAILIIFNTIRMAIFSRRDEVEIMRLIGSTNSYIRGPFLFEAMLDGVIAAVFALFVGYLTIFVGGPKLISFIDLTDTLNFFQTHWTLVGLITMASGMLIGTISSTLAMIRYLKL